MTLSFGTDCDSPARRADSAALVARGLARKLGQLDVLRHIDLAIAAGEVVVLRGANGAGKTTLLRCLAGVLRPSAGEVLWLGERASANLTSRRLIGFAGHASGLYDELSALENLVFAARMCGHGRPVEAATRWLESCGLYAWKHQPVMRLSRGMQQRVAIGRAVIHEPPIVLLDEPFNGLDHQGRRWLADWLRRLAENRRTVCLSSHGEELDVDLSCRVLWLESGCVIENMKSTTVLLKSA